MIAEDALIEYAQYVGNYYGTPRSYVEEQLALGKDVILEIEIQGALKVKKRFPDTLLLFVTPPSAGELKNRLIGRENRDDGRDRIAACQSDRRGGRYGSIRLSCDQRRAGGMRTKRAFDHSE